MSAARYHRRTDDDTAISSINRLYYPDVYKRQPEEWTDKDGVKHSRIIMVATKFYECPDKEETPAEEPAKPLFNSNYDGSFIAGMAQLRLSLIHILC